ncbi:MAG: DUF5686 family protein [Salinivirgaceae bacterium]|nr:DUF5686 family protein [Salinivirgaceae bacterium]MDD4748081.1 DUF5686 family protein [Salinivirgaceae bacterium]
MKSHKTTNFTLLLLLIALVFSTSAWSQATIKGTIIEKESKMPIAFASVVYELNGGQKGVTSDIYGKFEIQESNIKKLTVSCLGFKQNTISMSSISNPTKLVVELEIFATQLSEVIVKATEDPAMRIIRKVMENRAINNFENYENYRYRCYVKTLLELKFPNDSTTTDSATLAAIKKTNERAGFISEYVIATKKIDRRMEHKIIAQNTSGFKDPMYAQVFTSSFHHAISFYNNSLSLFVVPSLTDKSGTEYVSPLTKSATNSYTFLLEDTYMENNDSVFVINYYPRKGKNFSGLKGKLFVNSNGFAIQSIVVEPADKGLYTFRYKQDYALINNRWFPTTLDEEIGFGFTTQQKSKAHMVFRISNKIDNVRFDLPQGLKKEKISLEKVYIDKISIRNSDSIINIVRPNELTLREIRAYSFLDSLGAVHNFDYIAKIFPKIANGKYPISIFDIDLTKLFSNNQYEGTRLGIGLMTNENVLDFASVGGFVGYGTKDEDIKYGGQLIFDINKQNEVRLKFDYQNNLKEVGTELKHTISTQNQYLRSLLGSLYDNCIEQRMEFSFRALRYLKLSSAVSHKKITPKYVYQFKDSAPESYHNDEFELMAQYSYKERFTTISSERLTDYPGNPIVNFTYKRGKTNYSSIISKYNKFTTSIDLIAYNGRVGQSNIRLEAGYIDQSIPYGMMFTGEGSQNKQRKLVINNSFQTMMPYEFLSNAYVHLFYSHNFGSLLIKGKYFNPLFVVAHNCGWGTLKSPQDQDIEFRTKEKVFLESGLIIKQIIRFNILDLYYFGFGAGAFYRYGYYGFPDYKDNIAIKLAFSVTFK